MTNSNTNLTQPKSTEYHIADLKIISLKHFILLCVTSFGLYPIWWMFKAWRFFAIKNHLNIMPAVRAVFSIFFLYSLFSKIENYAQENGNSRPFSAAWMFIGYLISTFASYLPSPYWLLSLLSILFLIPAFVTLNNAKIQSTDINAMPQEKLGTGHIVVVAIGSLFWLLILIGLFTRI